MANILIHRYVIEHHQFKIASVVIPREKIIFAEIKSSLEPCENEKFCPEFHMENGDIIKGIPYDNCDSIEEAENILIKSMKSGEEEYVDLMRAEQARERQERLNKEWSGFYSRDSI